MTFLCTRCLEAMCPDCKAIADEYAELLANRSGALANRDGRIERLEADLETARRCAENWKGFAELAYPEMIVRWMGDEDQKRPLRVRVALLERVLRDTLVFLEGLPRQDASARLMARMIDEALKQGETEEVA